MGIPHFEDLNLTTLLDALELRWTACEKMDGSYMEFGFEPDGRFYTRRKQDPKCYSVSDWPDEGWTNAFRAAHVAAEETAEFLAERQVLTPGTYLQCEVIYGDRPNTILYPCTATLAINAWSYSRDLSPVAFTLRDFKITLNDQIYHSYDAKTKQLRRIKTDWQVLVQEPISNAWIWARLKHYSESLKKQLVEFKQELVPGMALSRGDLLKIPLNRRPGFVFPEAWPTTKVAIKETRHKWQKEIVPELQAFRQLVIKALLTDQTTQLLRGGLYNEGLVVTTWSHHCFKFVDREGFTKANAFSHWVKYNLVGGRRPKRGSFLSRTQHWPLEKRLERLEVLRERYLKYHHLLHREFTNCYRLMPVAYERELHERTKLLFVDVRERLLNGR